MLAPDSELNHAETLVTARDMHGEAVAIPLALAEADIQTGEQRVAPRTAHADDTCRSQQDGQRAGAVTFERSGKHCGQPGRRHREFLPAAPAGGILECHGLGLLRYRGRHVVYDHRATGRAPRERHRRCFGATGSNLDPDGAVFPLRKGQRRVASDEDGRGKCRPDPAQCSLLRPMQCQAVQRPNDEIHAMDNRRAIKQPARRNGIDMDRVAIPAQCSERLLIVQGKAARYVGRKILSHRSTSRSTTGYCPGASAPRGLSGSSAGTQLSRSSRHRVSPSGPSPAFSKPSFA